MLWLQGRNWLRRQEAQSLTEYALIVALAAIICIAAVTVMGAQIAALWQKIASGLSGL